MKRGLDTNVLVYAHVASLADHAAVRAYLTDELARRDRTFVITPSVLHEFVHVVTDGRRFDPPVAMGDALAVARLYLERSNVECAVTDGDALTEAFGLVERHRLGRNRLADCLLASTLLRHGVRELVTANRRDFEVFDAFKIIDPRTDHS